MLEMTTGLHRVARRIDDRRVLKLIPRFLQAGRMADGVKSRQQGHKVRRKAGRCRRCCTNILLTDLDRELERTGLLSASPNRLLKYFALDS